MSDKAQPTTEDARRPSHAVGISVGVVVAVIVLYVLSAPMVLVLLDSLGMSHGTLMTIYGPLDYLYRNSETFAAAWNWYMSHVVEPIFTP